MRNTLKTLGLTALVAGSLMATGCSKTENLDDMKYKGYSVNKTDANYNYVFEESTPSEGYLTKTISVQSPTKISFPDGNYDLTTKKSILGRNFVSYKPSN